MPLIAILPTGDWAQIESENDVLTLELTDAQMEALSNCDYSQSTILGMSDALDLDKHLGLDKRVKLSEITPAQAKQWLIDNDREGASHWHLQPETAALIDAVRENLRDYGHDSQNGDLTIIEG